MGFGCSKNIIMKINKVQIFGLHMHYLQLHIVFEWVSTTLCDDKILNKNVVIITSIELF